ncbi:MAG: permease [Sphaerochaeta sp.]
MWSILPILLLFVLGFVLQRSKCFSEPTIAGIKRIVSDLALPALMFQAFSHVEMESSYLILVVTIFMVCLVMVLLGKALAKPLGMSSPYFPLMMGGFEMGMLGYALFISVYGVEHLGKLALVDLGQVLFVFFVLMALLIKERDGVHNKGVLLRQFITSPVILAIFAGILASIFANNVSPNPLFTALGEFIDLLARLTVPLIAISIGYGIHIKGEGLAKAFKTILVRKVLLVAFALLINRFLVDNLLGMSAIYRYAVLLMFLTPPPFIITIFMKKGDKENADYVDNTLSMDTLVSLILVMVATTIYR